jgi:hypothetical protein
MGYALSLELVVDANSERPRLQHYIVNLLKPENRRVEEVGAIHYCWVVGAQ